ncbi:uncharacterized protein [Chelonus insularis]|uniref:uncharacterized protein n=1 Tax=Chelonus insularis TaxID=460826 RepID=UPI00158EE227|nr:uncharacterized protein LOC118067753 [Chelonus insularis]
MLGRLKYVLGILIFSFFLASVVQGQGMSGSDATSAAAPNLAMQTRTSDGVVGGLLRYLRPFSRVVLQFINSALIRTAGVQLPCTIYNLSKMEYSCTPVKVNVTMATATESTTTTASS